MIQDLQRIEYRRGLLKRGKQPAGLSRQVWRGAEIPPVVRAALGTENLLGLVGHYGDKQAGEFLIAVGEAAHEKHRFRTGMELSGGSVKETVPGRDLLLRPEKLPLLPSRTRSESTGAQGHVLHGGGLG